MFELLGRARKLRTLLLVLAITWVCPPSPDVAAQQGPADAGSPALSLGRAQRDSGLATGRREYFDRSLETLGTLVARQPESSSGWFELSQTQLAMWRARTVPKDAPYQHIGDRFLDAAASSLLAAAARESDGQAAEALAGLMLDPSMAKFGLSRSAAPLLDSFGRQSHADQSSAFYLAWGRVADAFGDSTQALNAFHHACTGSDTAAAGCFEEARVGLRLGAPMAESLYYRTLASADSEVIDRARSDFALIADSAELAGLGATAGADRSHWAEEFWSRRAMQDFRSPTARLKEHYRRVAYVERRYRIVQWPRRYERWELYRPLASEFDDRGVIYIRQGTPDTVVTFIDPVVQACPNESWLYRRPGGNLVFHFVARSDVDDWRLVEHLADASSPGGPTRSYDQCPRLDFHELVASRLSIDPIYGRMAVAGMTGMITDRERRLVRNSLDIGTTTDRYAWRFAKPLDPVVQVYGVMREGAATGTLLVVFALRAGQLAGHSSGTGSGWVYPLRIRVEAVDSIAQRAFAHDTVRAFAARERLGGDEYLTGTASIEVPAADYRTGIVLSEPGTERGQAVETAPMRVVSATLGGLQLSDVVLGREDAGLTWPTPGGAVPLNPLNAFAAESDVMLYYQASGLRVGASYTTSISLAAKRRARGADATRLQFQTVATTSFAEFRRSLSLRHLAPGTYLLSVTITPPSGPAFRREQLINVVAR